jgi:hypothetical protein
VATEAIIGRILAGQQRATENARRRSTRPVAVDHHHQSRGAASVVVDDDADADVDAAECATLGRTALAATDAAPIPEPTPATAAAPSRTAAVTRHSKLRTLTPIVASNRHFDSIGGILRSRLLEGCE